MLIESSIFKDYDIRAIVPDQLDSDGLRRIAQAIVARFSPRSIQVGRDMRLTSPDFHKVFTDELLSLGVNVVDLGFTSTDMLYFASGYYDEDMAINISASHNPPEYNGMKIVRKGAVAVSGRSGIYDIRDLALSDKNLKKQTHRGKFIKREIINEYINKVTSFIDINKMKPFEIVSDTGNGMAGFFMPYIEEKMPWKVERMYYELDGSFPNHVPSPIEEKNRLDCVRKIKEIKADLGFVFDGDGDRVFLIDELGRSLSGTIVTAIIAENMLQNNAGENVLYNAVVGRVVPEIIKKEGGVPHRVRVGHTLIKEDMRKLNGIFCGEHSGHYYFREFYFADSAIIAALLVLDLMSKKNKKLSELYDEYDKYPGTGQTNEINFVVDDKEKVMKKIEEIYSTSAASVDSLDGVSVWFDDWWFNIRPSNTEPLLRLNIEANNEKLFLNKLKELEDVILNLGGKLKQ